MGTATNNLNVVLRSFLSAKILKDYPFKHPKLIVLGLLHQSQHLLLDYSPHLILLFISILVCINIINFVEIEKK